jgi:hypothetical protein
MAFFKQFRPVPYAFGSGLDSNIIDIFRYIRIDDNLLDQSSSYQFYQVGDGERPDVVSDKLYNTPDYYWTLLMVNQDKDNRFGSWPLSTQEFNQYMAKMYEGTIVNARPEVQFNTDGQFIGYTNSVAGQFIDGETVTGFLSGATGTVANRDSQLNQLHITNVVGTFQPNELIRGQVSQDSISSYEAFDAELAPRYYVDASGSVQDNSLFIVGGVSPTELDTVTNREHEEAMNDERRMIRVIKPQYIEDFVITYKKTLKGAV